MKPHLLRFCDRPDTAARRFRFAVRAVAYAVVMHETWPARPAIYGAARDLIDAWHGYSPKKLRVAERRFVASLFQSLAASDQATSDWMRRPDMVRLPGRHGDAA